MEILTPKNKFICDKCNKPILKPEDGYVQWLKMITSITKSKLR